MANVLSATFSIEAAMAQTCLDVQVIVDLGNSDLKIKARSTSSTQTINVWKTAIFPSLVAKLSAPQSGCFQVDGEYYLVGEEAKSAACQRTGATELGKINNALPLLTAALRDLYGDDVNLEVNLIYTSPSVKQYGQAIRERLKGEHTVLTPPDELGLESAKAHKITINKTVAQLEGHRAVELVKDEIDNRVMLVDIGSRTIIATVVDQFGRVIARKAFDNCGVRGIASRIVAAESLANMNGLKLCPSEEDVIEFILGKGAKKTQKLIEPQIKACTGELSIYIADIAPNIPIYLLGGGATLPGLAKLLNAAIIDTPQWATVNGLCAISSQLFERA